MADNQSKEKLQANPEEGSVKAEEKEVTSDAKELERAQSSSKKDSKTNPSKDASSPKSDHDTVDSEKKGPAHAQASGAESKSSGKAIGIGIAAVVVIVAIIACCFAFLGAPAEEAQEEAATELVVAEATSDDGLPKSPIDWAEWQGINNNVYAWISIPDTDVNLPVLQHPIVENYYLEHDIYGNSTIAGAIYSQKTYNSKDFQDDPVTVLYGHTFDTNDTMFGSLHNFEDGTFFEEHPYFYIYTPEYNLTYEIISAYEWDNKLILAKYDVNNLNVQQQYFDIVSNPESTNKNVRAMDRLIAGEDHIVQLSTCTRPSNSNKRYLVTGVLVGAEAVSSDVAVEPNGEIVVEQ